MSGEQSCSFLVQADKDSPFFEPSWNSTSHRYKWLGTGASSYLERVLSYFSWLNQWKKKTNIIFRKLFLVSEIIFLSSVIIGSQCVVSLKSCSQTLKAWESCACKDQEFLKRSEKNPLIFTVKSCLLKSPAYVSSCVPPYSRGTAGQQCYMGLTLFHWPCWKPLAQTSYKYRINWAMLTVQCQFWFLLHTSANSCSFYHPMLPWIPGSRVFPPT